MSEQLDAQTVVKLLCSCRRPFNYALESRIGRNVSGLYAFWLGQRCLYVGMSMQLVRRLHQHRMQEHNEVLARFMSAFWRDIEMSYVQLTGCSKTDIHKLERSAIRALKPRTNVLNTPY